MVLWEFQILKKMDLSPLVVGLIILAGISLRVVLLDMHINPARDLGPYIAHAILPIKGKRDSDWGYSWIPIVGPIIGGIIAAISLMQFLI